MDLHIHIGNNGCETTDRTRDTVSKLWDGITTLFQDAKRIVETLLLEEDGDAA